jgi:hypothetical protein
MLTVQKLVAEMEELNQNDNNRMTQKQNRQQQKKTSTS